MIAALALAVGLLFPNVHVRALTGEHLETRQHRGAPLVYVLGFTHESRREADAWRRAIFAATGGSLRAIEVPVLSGMGVLMRPVIENSMTRKTPAGERAHVQVTTDRSTLVEGLRIADPEAGSVLTLVDARGEVRLVLRGAPTPEKEASLLAGWRHLRGEP